MKGHSKGYLDKLWAKRVKEGGECELSHLGGCYGNLNAHHIHHRSSHSTRWWLGNGICLCEEHHTAGNYSAHQNPIWFMGQLISLRGCRWRDELIKRAAECCSWKKLLSEIKAYLKNEREDYL